MELGPLVTFVFENRETVKFQVQEIIRIENLRDEESIVEEIEIFNTLIPEKNQLCATMLISNNLQELNGLEESVKMTIDDEEVEIEIEPESNTDEKTSAVHYIKWNLASFQAQNLHHSNIRLLSTHPEYRFSVSLSLEQTRALASDLF